MTLLNDRSQGGTSLGSGSVEVMLHRRCLFDDGLGVGEGLNELTSANHRKGLVVNGIVSMIFDTVAHSARLHRELAHEINNKPLILFNTNAENEKHLKALSGFSGLGEQALPPNLHLLSLQREYSLNSGKPANSLLVRIEHFYEKDEDEQLSQPVRVNIKEVFQKSFNIVDIEELGLGANARTDEIEREKLRWKADDVNGTLNKVFDNKYYKRNLLPNVNDKFTFNFSPMQIRTFRLFTYRNDSVV